MQLILLAGIGDKPRTYTVTRRVIWLAGTFLAALIIALAGSVGYVLSDYGLEGADEAALSTSEATISPQTAGSPEALADLRARVHELQARLSRLDALGGRLSAIAGIKSLEQDAPKAQAKPGQGGPLVPLTGSSADLKALIDELTERTDDQEAQLTQVESEINGPEPRKATFPSGWPIEEASLASGFGARRDPFTRRWARHEGLDFSADRGTPILAAAGGVVVTSERHSHYGNMVELDHGNGLTTRYAHASRLLVQPGDAVARGEQIALVGSTGRSTGPHLHFEVRKDGVAQNPMRFLRGHDTLSMR